MLTKVRVSRARLAAGRPAIMVQTGAGKVTYHRRFVVPIGALLEQKEVRGKKRVMLEWWDNDEDRGMLCAPTNASEGGVRSPAFNME